MATQQTVFKTLFNLSKGKTVFEDYFKGKGMVLDVFGFNPQTDPFVFVNQGNTPSYLLKDAFDQSNFDEETASEILPESHLGYIVKHTHVAGKFNGKSIYFYDTSMINAYFEDHLSEEEKDLLNYYLLSLATLQILNGKLSKDVLNQDFVDYDICTITVVE